MSKREIMSDEELASLEFLADGEAPNCRERWRFVVTPRDPNVVAAHDYQRDDYLISTAGRVVRIKAGCGTRVGTVLRVPKSGDGYPTVSLSAGGIPHTWNVHKLVATTFHGQAPKNEFGQFHAHHVNAKRDDNRAANLEWISAEDNISAAWHKWRGGR